MIKKGMMVTNNTLEIVGRVVYTDETETAVQNFAGKVYETNTVDCEEVTRWVRLIALISIGKKLVKFFIHRIAK